MITVYDNKNECCGCTACENICPTKAIKMRPDEEGFLYPKIDTKLCIDCGLCRDVCDFQIGDKFFDNFDTPEVFAIKHKSNNVRKKSSSGGAFTAISDYVLSKKGIIYGVAYDIKFNVFHKRVVNHEGRNSMRGSKYVQSDLKGIFSQVKDDLQNERYVLFTGTPCQVAGLNNYLIKSKVNMSKLLTTDIICHGTPSPKIFHDYILFLEMKSKSKLINYNFRSKVNGWKHTEEAVFKNGKREYNTVATQVYKKLFYSNLCLRPSCYQCKYTSYLRPADITIADYWGVENYFPEFTDNLGVSAVLLNNQKGKDVFKSFTEDIYMVRSNINDCARRQANLHNPSPKNPRRDEFWCNYLNYGFMYIAKKYGGDGVKGKAKKIAANILRQFGLFDKLNKLLSNKN